MMVFIDGENVVCRYQDMIGAGRKPHADTKHRPDVYAWNSRAIEPVTYNHSLLSATYYTSAVAAHEEIAKINAELRALAVISQRAPLPVTLTPFVNKTEKRQRASKGVDIRLCVDMLSHVHNDNVDTVVLVTGDGDFEPLVQEAKRSGKSVVIAAFSSGLNERLRLAADHFHELDNNFLRL